MNAVWGEELNTYNLCYHQELGLSSQSQILSNFGWLEPGPEVWVPVQQT